MEYFKARTDQAIDKLFSEVARTSDLKSGDITPLQFKRLEEAKEQIATVMSQWHKQNTDTEYMPDETAKKLGFEA